MIKKITIYSVAVTGLLILWFIVIYSFNGSNLKSIISKQYQMLKNLDNYQNKIIDNQFQNNQQDTKTEIIETSRLPLNIQPVYIPDQIKFANFGGDIAIMNQGILLTDRLGNLFAYKNKKFIGLDIKIPNNLADFLSSPFAPNLNVDTMRTHSIAFSGSRSEIFVSFTKFISPTKLKFVVSSINIDSESLTSNSNWRTLYEADIPPSFFSSSQAGGGKLFLIDNKLFFAVGYANERDQNLKLPFGKIFSLNLIDNKIEEISAGHRNIQGITMDSAGNILATEHGPQGGDEVNLINLNKNYGFPYQTYGTEYFRYSWPSIKNDSREQFAEPVFSFIPSIGICGIIFLNGYNPNWDGNLLIGSLKSQSIFRSKYIDGRLIFIEPIYLGYRIRSLAQNGKIIYALTDNSFLLEITANEELLKKNQKGSDGLNDSSLIKCGTCHNFDKIQLKNSTSISLHKIIGRPIASLENYRYSPSLSLINGNWSKDSLKSYLLSPNTFAPGTNMPNLGLNETQVDQIIKSLENK